MRTVPSADGRIMSRTLRGRTGSRRRKWCPGMESIRRAAKQGLHFETLPAGWRPPASTARVELAPGEANASTCASAAADMNDLPDPPATPAPAMPRLPGLIAPRLAWRKLPLVAPPAQLISCRVRRAPQGRNASVTSPFSLRHGRSAMAFRGSERAHSTGARFLLRQGRTRCVTCAPPPYPTRPSARQFASSSASVFRIRRSPRCPA
jgi:hypothetical protein